MEEVVLEFVESGVGWSIVWHKWLSCFVLLQVNHAEETYVAGVLNCGMLVCQVLVERFHHGGQLVNIVEHSVL